MCVFLTDLSGKKFTFPTVEGLPHVILHAAVEKMTAMTMCQRFFSELTRLQSLFSMATHSNTNALLLTKNAMGVYKVHRGGGEYTFRGLPDKTNEWNSICWTWDSRTGLTQLWLNGKRSTQKILTYDVLVPGIPSIMLGQEQDAYRGGFDPQQAFEGDVTDVHFWDYVISPWEIKSYMKGGYLPPGNLINWKELKYEIVGRVYVQGSDFDEQPGPASEL